MAGTHLVSLARIWAAALMACALLLIAEACVPYVGWGPTPAALVVRLTWLALIGSPLVAIAVVVVRGVSPLRWWWWLLAAAGVGCAIATAIQPSLDILLAGQQIPVWLRNETARAQALAAGAAALWFVSLLLLSQAHRKHWLRHAVEVMYAVAPTVILIWAVHRFHTYDYAILPGAAVAAITLGAWLASVQQWHATRWPIGLFAVLALVIGAHQVRQPGEPGRRDTLRNSRIGGVLELVLKPIRAPDLPEVSLADCEPRKTPFAPLSIPEDARRNVIIVSIDALRADVLGKRVKGQPIAPNLEALRARSVYYDRAIAPYPATLLSLGSAFTGWSPGELFLAPELPRNVFDQLRERFDRRVALLPRSSWFTLSAVRQLLTRGLNTEFMRSDRAATDRMLSILRRARRQNERVLAWIHYYAPHGPYQKHADHDYGPGRKPAYYGEVSATDAEFGRLFRYLEKSGWLSDSLIIVLSDHGEALGERLYWGHHVYLNGWISDVPLFVLYPGVHPRHSKTPVSLADVAPTVLHFAGATSQPNGVGVSLFESSATDRLAIAEAFPIRGRRLFESMEIHHNRSAEIDARLRQLWRSQAGYEPKVAATRGAFRYIHNRSSGMGLLFDRDADPSETDDLFDKARPTRERIASELERWERAQRHRIACRLLRASQAKPKRSPRLR